MQHILNVYHFNEIKRTICALTGVNKKMASKQAGNFRKHINLYKDTQSNLCLNKTAT